MRMLVLTFDNLSLQQADKAIHSLQLNKIPATFFVTPSDIPAQDWHWWDELGHYEVSWELGIIPTMRFANDILNPGKWQQEIVWARNFMQDKCGLRTAQTIALIDVMANASLITYCNNHFSAIRCSWRDSYGPWMAPPLPHKNTFNAFTATDEISIFDCLDQQSDISTAVLVIRCLPQFVDNCNFSKLAYALESFQASGGNLCTFQSLSKML